MRLQLLLLFLAVISFGKTYCQNIDPFLTGAIIVANATENSNYKNIKDNQTAIQRAQEATIVVVDEVNQIQNKIYNGLMQVSTVLKNAYQIKECLQALKDILSYEADMLAEARQNPIALAFAVKIQNEMAGKAVAYYADIQEVVLKANTKDLLMTAGERENLLYNSDIKMNMLSQLFNTTTTTLSGLIKKDKAFLKYNYIVYLKENKSSSNN